MMSPATFSASGALYHQARLIRLYAARRQIASVSWCWDLTSVRLHLRPRSSAPSGEPGEGGANVKSCVWNGVAIAATVMSALPIIAQEAAKIDFKSVGRAAPVVDVRQFDLVGPNFVRQQQGQNNTQNRTFVGSALPGATPEGIRPLQTDLFTSRDFYKDRELWSDPRYFRCGTSVAIEAMWAGNGAIGDNGPRTAAWGHCDNDLPREAIVSPYSFKTAQEHYAALLEETKKRGGPIEHTYATVPGEWTGRYNRAAEETWYQMRRVQIPTVLSLLTPQYQTYVVQEAYHHGNTNSAQWPSQYCWPEGFMRRWHNAAVRDHFITVTPQVVQILTGVARNFITNVLIGREFNMEGAVPRLGPDVPRWYGETIGFWDSDTLITWTSNVVGWKVHATFEFSNKLQAIEIYTPNRDATGKFVGLNHEAIFYDPEAFVEPLRIVRNFNRLSDMDQGDPYVFIDCVQTLFPINGIAQPMTPGTVFDFEMPDMFGRPWAQIYEKYHEQGMERPENEDLFNFQ
jgi:hypothetical protein